MNELSYGIAGAYDFSATAREVDVPLGTILSPLTQDVLMHLNFRPTLNQFYRPNNDFNAVENIRVYADEVDITTALQNWLGESISRITAQTLETSYLSGVERLVCLLEGTGLHSDVLTGLKTGARNYLKQANWPKAFAKLGSRDTGWRGNLHPINYLYSDIPLARASLKEVVTIHNKNLRAGDPKFVNLTGLKRLTISHGTATHTGQVSGVVPGGRLEYQLEVVISNPLQDEFEMIMRRLKQLALQLAQIRTVYLEPTTERIARVETDFASSAAAVRGAIDQLTEAVKNIK